MLERTQGDLTMPSTGEQLKQEKPGQRHQRVLPNYILATGEAGLSRLEMLEKIFGPYSRELLSRAGLAKWMRVADIGCRAGLVSLWIATQIGTSGSVVGVDASSEQLRVAEKNAAAAGLSNASS